MNTPVALDRMLYLKPVWNTSVAMQINRTHDLGLVDGNERRSLYKARSARGWSRSEPWDDETPLEQPRLLRVSLQVLIDEQVIPPLAIPESQRLSAADVETIAGLPERFFARHGVYYPNRHADPPREDPIPLLTYFPSPEGLALTIQTPHPDPRSGTT